MTQTKINNPSTEIELLAKKLLGEREFRLALHLAGLMERPDYRATYLIRQIIPVYHKNRQTLEPRGVYRLLYYVDTYSTGGHKRRLVRFFIHMMCNHIEECLEALYGNVIPRPWGQPMGRLVIELNRNDVIPDELAEQLSAFNKVVFVPAKHFVNRENLPRSIDKRTFGVLDGTLTFVMMRKLSIQLFEIMRGHGIILPEGWKDFDDRWLSWNEKVDSETALGDSVM